jgi:capsular exopolysaccharide synthesis family protein
MIDQNAVAPYEGKLVGEPVDEPYWADEDERGGGLRFSEIRAALYRQRWVILTFLALGVIVGGAASLLMPRSYVATSYIQFQAVPELLEAQKAVDPTQNKDFERQIKAQLAIVPSRGLAESVTSELNLTNNSAFLEATGLEPGAGQEEVVGALRGRVGSNNPWGTEVLEVSFSSANPTISALVANAYADNLIKAGVERRYQTSSYARDFLQQKLNEARQRLDQSEQAAVAYARQQGIVESPGGGGAESLSAASLMQMNSDLAAARSARIRAEQRWQQASATPLMSLPEVQSSGTVQGLLSRKAELSTELARLRQQFKDDYPDVARLRTQIGQIDAEIRTYAAQVRESVRDAYLTAARQEASMAGNIGGLRSQTLADQARRSEWQRINREAEGHRNLYNSLLQRFQEVSTAAGVTTNNMAVIERAAPPSQPAVPNPPLYLALAAAAGLILGLLIGLLRELMKDPIRSPDDVYAKLGVPLIGTTPVALHKSAHEELVYGNSALSEAYHSIRVSTELGTGTAPRSLLITSSRPGEGKSTTALALAADYASIGLKVLLIDADLRRSGLHEIIGGHNDAGLVDVLRNAALEGVVQHFENIDFLASGLKPDNPAEVLSSGRVREFIDKSSRLYDVILFDGPPVMGIADAPQIARVVEGTLLVVKANSSQRSNVQMALRRLRSVNAVIFGVILTKFDPASAGYGAKYGDVYDYSYGQGQDYPRLLGAG